MEIRIELDRDLAWSFAQFMKRVGYEDYRKFAASQEEAWEMMDANEKIRAAFADKGIAPR